MIKCDKNKKKDTIALLQLCPHCGLLELSIFVIKNNYALYFKNISQKIYFIVIFHICIYYTSFFNLFQ